VKLAQPLPIIVILVLLEDLIKSQNVHAHLINTKMEKRTVLNVTINAKNVKDLLIIVQLVLMTTDQISQIVNVKLDGMILELPLVDNVYQNVTNVTQVTTVQFVTKQELKDQKETAHAQMDNTNSNITVMIVKSNVLNVMLKQESVQNVLETEMVKPIAHAHTEHMMSVKLSAQIVNSHVKLVSIMQTNVKFVPMDMKTHQNVL
jgi:hypothetical protein